MQFETILTEIEENIMLITLNRPKSLNALNRQLAEETLSALRIADSNREIGCILITGSEKAFAAGADIKEMREHSFTEMLFRLVLTMGPTLPNTHAHYCSCLRICFGRRMRARFNV